MHVVSYSEARRLFKAVIDRAVNDHDAVLIHRRTGGNVVIVCETAYNSMVKVCSSPRAAQPVQAAAPDGSSRTDKP